MAHRICTPESGTQRPYFNRLWRTLFAPHVDPKTRLEHLFEQETVEFDLELAFLSNIDLEMETQHLEVTFGSHRALGPDSSVPLSETYCRKAVSDPEGTYAVSDALAEGWGDDPAYERFELESYLGTTIDVGDEFYGTLCFADTVARAEPFLEEEKSLLELHAEWVGYMLSIWEGPPTSVAPIETIEGHSLSDAGIDSMMNALENRRRRLVLMTLLETASETGVGALEPRLDGERDMIRLHHVDIPMLADAGYISWDSEERTVSKGPRFSELEPLVRLLAEYRREFME